MRKIPFRVFSSLSPLILLALVMLAVTGMTATKMCTPLAAGVADAVVRFGVGSTRLLDKKINGAQF